MISLYAVTTPSRSCQCSAFPYPEMPRLFCFKVANFSIHRVYLDCTYCLRAREKYSNYLLDQESGLSRFGHSLCEIWSSKRT